jgi:hypothetical protein
MDPTDKDVANNYLNKDRTFGIPYKVRWLELGWLQYKAGQPVPSRAALLPACTRWQGSCLISTLTATPPQDFITGPANAATWVGG